MATWSDRRVGPEMADSSTPMTQVSPPWWPEQAYSLQQPQWRQHEDYDSCCATLASAPALVTLQEIGELQFAMAVVASGGAHILQAGDCAESLYEIDDAHTNAKLVMLHRLADQLAAGTGQPVLRVGRLGGQFAKPRTDAVEDTAGILLSVFRGHMVNCEEPSPQARAHDPRRMVAAYAASAKVLGQVRADRAARLSARAVSKFGAGPWSSHDALVIDYEANLVRSDQGTRFLGSTHLPWIGDRTRQLDAAHVQLLSAVSNPVACKIGPSTSTGELRELCARLDPDRIAGRLTLIVRLGKMAVSEQLPALVAAVRAQGHPVVWLSDPMHGNTIRVGNGVKTRLLADILDEAVGFARILRRIGAHPAGLHLETAVGNVTECLGGTVLDAGHLQRRYTTLCDPRLNPEQAAELVQKWCLQI